ncbi:MAG: putative deacylase [Desulforhopalus sp.]
MFTFFFVQPVYTAQHQSLHDVYLANTEHQLHVYRIYGKKPGKTIMVIGGIQGDEPGGYLTADLYADSTLKRGNLIVVPRAIFYSILLNQRNGLTGDMNRKFGNKGKDHKNLEQEIVSILKGLIDESDCLLICTKVRAGTIPNGKMRWKTRRDLDNLLFLMPAHTLSQVVKRQ